MGKQTKLSKNTEEKKPARTVKSSGKASPSKPPAAKPIEESRPSPKSKKAIAKKPPKESPTKSKKKGKKSCSGCDEKIPIHLRICSYCGKVNNMKKRVHTLANIMSSSTPKGLQALLQSNQTNAVAYVREPAPRNLHETKLYDATFSVPKSTPYKVHTQDLQKMVNSYQVCQVTKSLSVFAADKELRCVRVRESAGIIAFTQQLSMHAIEMRENDLLTLKAHGLDHLIRISQRYAGQGYIYFMKEPYGSCHTRLSVPHFTVQMEWVNDQYLAVLTGEGQVVIYEVPLIPPPSTRMTTLTLKQRRPDRNIVDHQHQICCMEMLYGSPQTILACGDWKGNIYLYELTFGAECRYQLKRTILNAHNGYITALKNCPINKNGEVLFASGSYDGYIKIWSTKDLNPIYEEEVSNRKVMDLQWDSGAKFILVLVDDQNDGCILVSLYSSAKIEGHLHLLPTTQLRYIKELTHYSFSAMNPYLQYSAFASNSGVVALCPLEQLRKLSIKRKKYKAGESIVASLRITHDERGLHVQQQPVTQLVGDTLDLTPPLITCLDFSKHPTEALIAMTTSRGTLLIYRPTF